MTATMLPRVLEAGGEGAVAVLVAKLATKAEVARELALGGLHDMRAEEAPRRGAPYNGLVQSWPEIARLAHEVSRPCTEQGGLFERGEP